MNAAKSVLLLSLPALLAGCGGGSGGGGGGGSTPAPTTYTWQFVQMKELTNTAMTQFCGSSSPTIFNLDDSDADSNNWLYTFAAKAPTITDILVFNADGSPYTDGSLDKFDVHQTEGTLVISENDIPDGGYITVLDSANGIDNVLSVQKELLSDAIIKVNLNQGQQSCITTGKLAIDSAEKKVNLQHSSNNTSAQTYLDGASTPNTSTLKDNLTLLAENEFILLAGYNGSNDIIEYAYADKNSLSNSSAPIAAQVVLDPIADAATTVNFTNTLGANFSELDIKSVYRNTYTFDWFGWNATSNSFIFNAPLGSDYAYQAIYSGTLNGWNIEHVQSIDNLVESIDLTALDMSAANTPLDCASGVCQLSSTDVTALDSLSTQLRFSEGTARYTIFAENDVIVPQVGGVNYPDQTTPLEISMLLATAADSDLLNAFRMYGNTRNYQGSAEHIDIISYPSEDLQQQLTLLASDYTLVTR